MIGKLHVDGEGPSTDYKAGFGLPSKWWHLQLDLSLVGLPNVTTIALLHDWALLHGHGAAKPECSLHPQTLDGVVVTLVDRCVGLHKESHRRGATDAALWGCWVSYHLSFWVNLKPLWLWLSCESKCLVKQTYTLGGCCTIVIIP